MPTPACHPNRAHQAQGMCDSCYQSWYTKNKRKKRSAKDPADFAPNYRRPPHKAARVPDCHPDRRHAALGLCGTCYQRDRPGRERAQCHPDRPVVAKGLCNACYKHKAYEADPETNAGAGASVSGDDS